MSAEYPVESTPERDQTWRSEVASRVNNFKARRKNRADSMRLDFERAGSTPVYAEPTPQKAASSANRAVCDTNYYRRANAEAMAAAEPAAPAASFVETATAPALEPVYEPEPELAIELAPQQEAHVEIPVITVAEEPKRPVANVIVFPRATVEPPLAPRTYDDELAESIFERPRILDVPEDIVPAVQGNLFAEIHLDADEDQEPQPQSSFEVPLRVAPLMSRFGAMMMDWLVVWAASFGFAALSWKVLAGLPHTKYTMPILLVIPAVFWAVYQYLFLVYGGRTLGMEMSRLRVRTFDGERPGWVERKKRAVHSVLSLGAVTMGYLWAAVDIDHLCWHDRVSKTYVTHE
jgi:uncharacterized RDD family membrane protein YckC